MPKTTAKVKLALTPGSLTPVQKKAGKLFWQRLIAEVKREVGQ